MVINTDLAYAILAVFLAVVDVIVLGFLAYSIYLFRKSTYDFEKRIKQTLNSKK